MFEVNYIDQHNNVFLFFNKILALTQTLLFVLEHILSFYCDVDVTKNWHIL